MSGHILSSPLIRRDSMGIIRDQKPIQAVALESSNLEETAHAVTELSLPPDQGTINRPRAEGSENSSSPVERFFDLVIDELRALRTRAELDSLERAANLILDCESNGGRVHVTGIGKSEHIARYVASLLSSTGTPSYFLHATECIHGSAGQVCRNDVVIAISNSGTTPELLSAIE